MYESNQDVMAALYEAYEQPMYGIAYAILHDRYQAEDAVQEAFIRMVRYLPKCRDQDVIRMRFYYGMPVAAISKELGISEDNVYQRLSRARKLVKEIIGEDLAHEERIG